jgi:hypothetical protein
MKKIVFLSMLFFSMLSIAQENYKVIIMPKKFDFLKSENEYNLNVLCKSFFEKEGFQVYYITDKLPLEVANNRCNALFLDLIEDSNMFKTKIKIELKDCQNNVVSFSDETESREKNINAAYNEVTRAALISMKGFINVRNSYAVSAENKKEVKESVVLTEEKVTSNKQEISIENKKLVSVITKNGYNLVNENKNVKFELLKTSNPTIFIAKKGNVQGVFSLNGMNSVFESYQNNELIVEKVEVKF